MMHRSPLQGAVLSLLLLAGGTAGLSAAETARVSGPFTHENLSVYFLHAESAPGPVPLTLAEALEGASIAVVETGEVTEVAVENLGDSPIFIQRGDVIKGGKQDRVLTVSLLLPPKSGRVAIGSYCVEQGRWSERGGEDAGYFSSAGSLMPSKEAKLALVAEALKASPAGGQQQTEAEALALAAYPYSAQSAIWNSVAATQDRLSAALGTSVASAESQTSLQLSLENEKLNREIDAYVAALSPKGHDSDEVIGFVFAVNGTINSGDAYPSNGLFVKMWPKLLRAAATEAIGEKADASAEPPAAEAVADFVGEAEQAKLRDLRQVDRTKLESRRSETTLYTVTHSASGSLLHKSYLTQ